MLKMTSYSNDYKEKSQVNNFLPQGTIKIKNSGHVSQGSK